MKALTAMLAMFGLGVQEPAPAAFTGDGHTHGRSKKIKKASPRAGARRKRARKLQQAARRQSQRRARGLAT
jgi:hypothetical protein